MEKQVERKAVGVMEKEHSRSRSIGLFSIFFYFVVLKLWLEVVKIHIQQKTLDNQVAALSLRSGLMFFIDYEILYVDQWVWGDDF